MNFIMSATYNPMSLVGKAILVTGASSGIGQAIAIECSKLGATVICTARNEERLQKTLSMMEGEGHSYLVADLNDTDAMDSLIAALPKLDGVSHNAGIGQTMLTTFAKETAIESMIQTNLMSVVLLQTRLLKARKIRKNASVVFMSSISSHLSGFGNAFYAMAKSGLTAYARTLALELAAKGIRVNTVHPGMTLTPLILRDQLGDEQRDADVKNYPLGRYGNPEEIAHVAAFLLSDASSWVTGSRYFVDGGRMTH